MNTLIGSLPKHQYIWVDSKFTHDEPIGFVPAIWFGLVSFPSRAWGFNVMLENGGVYRSLPPHAISFEKQPQERNWTIHQSQLWDCYGYNWTAVEYTYLKGLACKCKIGNQVLTGTYLFTVAPLEDGFSNRPDQAKEFKFIQLDNSRITIQPTNKVMFHERSFTDASLSFKLKLQEEIYSCEQSIKT